MRCNAHDLKGHGVSPMLLGARGAGSLTLWPPGPFPQLAQHSSEVGTAGGGEFSIPAATCRLHMCKHAIAGMCSHAQSAVAG